jgi:hypothetical protein
MVPLLSGSVAGRAANADSGAVQFAAHEIATGFSNGYHVVLTDMNRDGKPDIIAVAQGDKELDWFENPGWQRHLLIRGANIASVAALDLDGDGIPELAVGQGFATSPKTSTGIISLVTHGADVTQPWNEREIDRVPTAHRLRWMDPDGSGRHLLLVAPLVGPDAVPPDLRSPVSIFSYEAPDWKRQTVATFTGQVHGMEVVSWPGVKGRVALSAGFMGIHLHRYAGGRWAPELLQAGDPDPWPKSGASDVALGHLGWQPFIATIEPFHGNVIAIYTETKGGWQRRVIDDMITQGHAVLTVDIDRDGRDEVLVGQRGATHDLVLYTASRDGATWSKRVLDEGGMAASGCGAADLNADGRVDLVCIGTATANLKWYENKGR